jgi:hypothetical protein
MDLARAPRRRPLTARKKGSGYENGQDLDRMCPGVCPQLRGNDYSGSFLNKGGGQTLFCIVIA